MKYVSWCSAVALLSQVLASASAGNLLVNPQFSAVWKYPVSLNGGNISGFLPNGWGDNTGWAGPGINIRYALAGSSGGGSGGGSLQASILAGFMQFGQTLGLHVGSAYRLCVWVRAEAPADGALRGAVVSLHLRLAREPYTEYGLVSMVAGRAWRQLSVVSVVLPGPKASPSLECFFQVMDGSQPVLAGGPAAVWLANASLTPLAPTSPQPPAAVLLPPPPAAAVPRDFFCLNIAGLFGDTWFWAEPEPFKLAYTWAALDFGMFRTWDSGVMWNTVQPSRRGEFNFTLLDYMVGQAQRRRQKVLFTLGQTPRWASSRPTELAAFGVGAAAPPRQMRDWTAFLRALARRYKGRIHAYEVWNEPDIKPDAQGYSGFYSGTPQQLVGLEAAAADVLAREDPSALLVAPAMSGYDSAGSNEWLRRYLEAGGGRRTQAVAWHAYIPAPEAAISVVATLRQLLASYGLQQLPVWNTEGGLDARSLGLSARSAAGFVARSLVVQWAVGLKRSCWYTYNAQAPFEGLTVRLPSGEREPGKLNAGGRAYRQVMSWILGARLVSLMPRPDGIWLAELRRPGTRRPRRSWIVWIPSGTARKLVLPSTWQEVSWQDAVTGKVTSLGGGAAEVPVGEVPLLVVAGT